MGADQIIRQKNHATWAKKKNRQTMLHILWVLSNVLAKFAGSPFLLWAEQLLCRPAGWMWSDVRHSLYAIFDWKEVYKNYDCCFYILFALAFR